MIILLLIFLATSSEHFEKHSEINYQSGKVQVDYAFITPKKIVTEDSHVKSCFEQD